VEGAALAQLVKSAVREAGFDLVGIAGADAPAALAFFPEWVARGHAGEMAYLSGQVRKRSALRAAFPWARSLVCAGLQYDTPHPYSTEAPRGRGWISRYAWGDDYHDVMKVLLEAALERLHGALGAFEARAYVDTGPIVERAYAAAAGLGAWGKNTCLLHPEHGSWFFLGELVTDLEIPADAPREDMCGSCTACLEACPTGALPAPYVLDARRCISYLTIELRGEIPEPRREGMGTHVFGCDICQDVCPWNRRPRRAPASAHPSFAPRTQLVNPQLEWISGMKVEEFRSVFRASPVKRAKLRGLLRSAAIAMGNSGERSFLPRLRELAQHEDEAVAEHARWAIARLERRPSDACSDASP
jgi:epoxyqueuosine reductase